MVQLQDRCGDFENPIGSVWVPENPHVITVFEARCLFEQIRGVENRFARKGLFRSIGITALLGVLWWQGGARGGIFMLLMVILGVIPTIQQVWQIFRLTRLTPEAMARWPDSIRYQRWLNEQPAKLTIILLIGLGAVFISQVLAGMSKSIFIGGLNRAAIEQGEYWRAVTATLLHGNVVHILFNGMAMYYLGRPVEVLAGRNALVGVFVVSMLTGAGFSLLMMPAGQTSVGASGGILGLLGFLIVFGIRYRKIVPNGFTKNLAANVVFIAFLGLAFAGMIDNGGHLGGLLGGLLCGALLILRDQYKIPMEENIALKSLGGTSMLYLVLAAAFTIAKLAPSWRW
jgi:membrane associated rhomboid family serine protease